MNCNTTPFVVYPTQYSQTNCPECADPSCGTTTNAKCIYYAGAALPCSGVNTNDNLEVVIQKIEEKICEATGSYATYDTACLAPINTQQEFVEAISAGYCQLLADFTEFVNVTFPASESNTSTEVNTLASPEITCTVAGVIPSDDLPTVLTKYCTTFGDLYNKIDVSGANWSSCYTVTPTPSTLTSAFNVLISQICDLKASVTSGSLGNFDNTCIGGGPSVNAATSLQAVINYMCDVPTFDPNALSFGCVAEPAPKTLDSVMQTVLNQLTDYIQNKLTFSGDFVVSLNNPLDPCQGKLVELATPLVTDRLVASNLSDTTPGTLIQKLDAGTNVTLDDTTIPGKVIINANTTPESFKVKASTIGADTEGYLINKIDGVTNSSDGVAISETYNGSTEKVDLTPSIDWTTFITKWFAELNSNSTLALLFCSQVQNCIDNSLACYSFSVSLDTGSASTGNVTYVDCNGNPQSQALSLATPTATFCARNIISTSSFVTVSNLGACVVGTTTTDPYTTTTTTPVVYDYYLATQRACADCGTVVATNVAVAFPTGSSVTIGGFYTTPTPDGNSYEITATSVSAVSLVLSLASYNITCGGVCGI